MQKRKNRIEQWRAERRTKLGIDKAMQQSISQTAQVRKNIFLFFSKSSFNFSFRVKHGHLKMNVTRMKKIYKVLLYHQPSILNVISLQHVNQL